MQQDDAWGHNLGNIINYAVTQVTKNSSTGKCVIIHDKDFHSDTMSDALLSVGDRRKIDDILVYLPKDISLLNVFLEKFLSGYHNILLIE